MTMTATAIFTQAVYSKQAKCINAKTTYTDATNAVLLHTFGANGGLLKALRARTLGTVTATQLQVFSSLDGALLNLVKTALYPAYTLSQTSDIPEMDLGFLYQAPRRASPNERIYVGIGVALAAGIVFDGEFEDF